MDVIVEGLCKYYRGQCVLQDFSCQFKEGVTTCIMGTSGRGKTTLLRLLLGLEQPDAGIIQGVPYGKVGAVFQESRLCENLSAVTNLKFVSGLGKEMGVIRIAMLDLKLQGAFHKPVRELSGGMKRRVEILRAVLADNTCIIMDEPLAGLDEETKELTAAYLKTHTKGKTLIVVTHDKREIELLAAEHILIL